MRSYYLVVPIAFLFSLTAQVLAQQTHAVTDERTIQSGKPQQLQQSGEPVTQKLPAIPADADGQTADSAIVPQPLTLDQALALAAQDSPSLHVAAAEASRAAGGIRVAREYTNPSIDYLVGPQYARPIETPGIPGLLQHIGVSQTVEIPSERHARIEAARLGSISSMFGEAAIQLSVMANVKHAFYDVLRKKEEISHTKENLALVQELRRRIAVEVHVGEKGRLELTRAEAELATAQSAVRSAQIELVKAAAALRAAIGLPLGMEIDPQGSLDETVKLPPLAEMRAKVLTTHPAMHQAREDVKRADAELSEQKALRIPQPTFTGEYERQPDLTFYRVGVHLPLPLWNRRKGEIDEAKAEQVRTVALEDQRRIQMLAALESAYEQYRLADQQVAALQSGALLQAETAVEGARSAYKFGERGILDVLDAQRVLQSVRDDLLNAKFARESALIDLQELGAVNSKGKSK